MDPTRRPVALGSEFRRCRGTSRPSRRGRRHRCRWGGIAGGTPLGDATAFAQWHAARDLVARGARTSHFDLAALGLTEELLARLDDAQSTSEDLNESFWSACHGGQLDTARVLASRGADLNFLPGWENATPLDIAARQGAHDVIGWLHGQGAHTCDELRDERLRDETT